MIIAYYAPNNYMAKFCQYSKNKFVSLDKAEYADIVYAGSLSILGGALEIAKRWKKPIICWVWDVPYNWREWCRNNIEYNEQQFRDESIKKRINLLKHCDFVISASRYTQRVLKQEYGILSTHLYFYIDMAEIDSIKCKFKKEDQVIQISRYALNKRFDITINAMKNVDWNLVFVGTGKKEYKSLEESAIRKKVNHTFFCDINRESTINHLKKSKILVSPSVFEGWGITPAEALYCDIPILLNDLEVFRELYGDKVLYHKKDDADDMREKLLMLIKDENLRKKIVKDCKPIVSEFTPQRFAQKFDNMMKS